MPLEKYSSIIFTLIRNPSIIKFIILINVSSIIQLLNMINIILIKE